MNKNKYIEVKFENVSNVIDELRGVSGLYLFHTLKHVWYVGKAVDLQNRFATAYLKKDGTPAHINKGLKQRIDAGCAMNVIFVPMSVELIEKKEVEVIGRACPTFNDLHNPREKINAIQVLIGKIVNESNKEWSYDNMIKHLWWHYNGQILSNRIEKALTSNWCESYCSRNRKKRILKPKKSA
ncbi:GIY-YIG nuclease family protein [Bacillus cereus]|uniref:GIY-YIG nuclease family protein n=2 Tax=Bacillus cereus group TaxID=86661 RepID=UPI000BFDA000|nr:GIY-YIG nuclease family protein [Bacillus cereus]PGL59677.1 hypothetical protein CN927_18525 [Bacillus cereus]